MGSYIFEKIEIMLSKLWRPLRKEFDYIIVGGGSAGCVLANRLSASNDVLLVEAGPYDHRHKFSVHAPGSAVVNMLTPKLNWYYYTQPQENLANRRLFYPRGRILGGQLNANCYIRGQPNDYDRWAEKANDEKFAYENVLPIFKQQQQAVGYGDDEFNGRNGFLKTSQNNLDALAYADLCKSYLKAAQQAGHAFNDDANGAEQEGFGFYATTTFKGVRQSASTAFLKPVEDRMTVMPRTLVSSVIIEKGNKATGVKVVSSNRLRRSRDETVIHARKEVILSGGAINSPQLLQMSGIGPADVLKNASVEVKVNSTGVGAHLQDHLQFSSIYHSKQSGTAFDLYWKFLPELAKWYRNPTSSALQSSLVPVFGFHKADKADKYPIVQHHFLPGPHENHGRSPGICRHGFSDHVCTLQQLSRGVVNIKNASPHSAPSIDPKCLSHPADLPDLVRAVKLTRDIMEQSALNEHRGPERLPGLGIQSDAQIEHWLRANLESTYHPVSTCRIGTDDESPVDADFKVKGVDNLRVADASVMPDITSGNTNAPTIMLAELCSRAILAD